MGQPARPTQPSIPLGSVSVSSNLCNYMYYGGGDHWTAGWDCACVCLAVRLQAHVCGLSLQPVGCTSALACDVQRYCSCSCRSWRYISVMPLPFTFNTACRLHRYFELRTGSAYPCRRRLRWGWAGKTRSSEASGECRCCWEDRYLQYVEVRLLWEPDLWWRRNGRMVCRRIKL